MTTVAARPLVKNIKQVAPEFLLGDKIQPGHPLFGVVWINRERVSGAPCFFGTRVPIKTLFDCLASGETLEQFLDDFEGVDREQALAVLDLAGHDLLDDLGPIPGCRTGECGRSLGLARTGPSTGGLPMVAESIRRVVRDYLKAATLAGIPTHKAVLFGSQAKGNAGETSDIDLVVVSSALEPPHSRDLVATLWRLCMHTDARIEPIACGEREWEDNDSCIILEIARLEGIVIEA